MARWFGQFGPFAQVAGIMSFSDRPSVLSHVAALGFMLLRPSEALCDLLLFDDFDVDASRFLFLNSGPNLTTYIIPAEIFPTCAGGFASHDEAVSLDRTPCLIPT